MGLPQSTIDQLREETRKKNEALEWNAGTKEVLTLIASIESQQKRIIELEADNKNLLRRINSLEIK